MARNKRICKTCKRQILRGEHWRMVKITAWESIRNMWPLNQEKPQHWNCLHPTQPSPRTFIGIEKQGDFYGIEKQMPRANNEKLSPT